MHARPRRRPGSPPSSAAAHRRGPAAADAVVGQRGGDQDRARAAVVHPAGERQRGGGGGVQAQEPSGGPAQHEGQQADERRHDQCRTEQQWARMREEGAQGATGVDVGQDERSEQCDGHDHVQGPAEPRRRQRESEQDADCTGEDHGDESEGAVGCMAGRCQCVRVAAVEERPQGGDDQRDGEWAEECGGEDESHHGGLVAVALAGPDGGSGGDGHRHDQDHRGGQPAATVAVGGAVQSERDDGDDQERDHQVQDQPGQQGGRLAEQAAQFADGYLKSGGEEHQGQQQRGGAQGQAGDGAQRHGVVAAQPQTGAGQEESGDVGQHDGPAEPTAQPGRHPVRGRWGDSRTAQGGLLPWRRTGRGGTPLCRSRVHESSWHS